MRSRGAIRLRGVTVWALTSVLAVAGLRWLWPELAGLVATVRDGQTADAELDQLVVWTAAVASAVALVWLEMMTTAVIVAALGGRPAHPVPGCPGWLRRAVLAGCGLALVAGLGGPAVADGHRGDPPALSGLALPDRAHVAPKADLPTRGPDDEAPTRAGPRGQARPDHAEEGANSVRVRPGDSLWRIASTLLPDGAGDREVARLAAVLHRANSDVIGPDPDLILPDQRLHVPPDPTRASRP